jgi:hypothetical protein
LKAAALAAGLTYTSLADATAEDCEAVFETDRLQSAWVTWLNETVNPLLATGDIAGVNAALEAKVF